MKFHYLLFLLAFIGHAHAQGIVCGVLGILCPPTTVAPTTTQPATITTTPEATEGTQTSCIDVPGSNVDLTINPAELAQDQIDQIGGLLDGLGGILNPGTTEAPVEGSGRICFVLAASDVDQLEGVYEIFSPLINFVRCVQGQVNVLQPLVRRISQFLKELNDLIQSLDYRHIDFLESQIKKIIQMESDFGTLAKDFRDNIQALYNCF
ncbi:hypothetical protein CAEBREN_13436 [Caenorhabditis brenneri]|uniref:Uncharacterized protein n=1 Tax=Caenorhabditis brenneri TaxID=135651 RepID=G0NTR7_CAEBE|nr:hypothetical protein CAEBREN_13436 [Caenorhabditis brenneri]